MRAYPSCFQHSQPTCQSSEGSPRSSNRFVKLITAQEWRDWPTSIEEELFYSLKSASYVWHRICTAFPKHMTRTQVMLKRLLLICLGTFFLVTGIIGLFIPVLPGILLLIAAAACFSSVSPPFNRWLRQNRRVQHWQSRWQSSTELPLLKRIQLVFWLSAESIVDPSKRVR